MVAVLTFCVSPSTGAGVCCRIRAGGLVHRVWDVCAKAKIHCTTQTCTQLRQQHENEEAAVKQASAKSTRFYVNGGEI